MGLGNNENVQCSYRVYKGNKTGRYRKPMIFCLTRNTDCIDDKKLKHS